MTTDEIIQYLERAANPSQWWSIPPPAAKAALAKLRAAEELAKYADKLTDRPTTPNLNNCILALINYNNAGKGE